MLEAIRWAGNKIEMWIQKKNRNIIMIDINIDNRSL